MKTSRRAWGEPLGGVMQQSTKRIVSWTTLCAAMSLGLVPDAAAAGKNRSGKRPPEQASFEDPLQRFDSARWEKADGWTNGPPFDNAWAADHVSFSDGNMILRLDDAAMLGEPYTSGEYRTSGYHGYGCFETSFRPVAQPGVVTSFFTFAGPYDNGGNGRHNEIDIEFLGDDTTRVQFNFWTNDDTYSSRNEALVDLGFDASAAAHAYGFRWTSMGIQWFVDGVMVFEALDAITPTPKATDSLHKIMMNLWPVDETAALWAGSFEYPGQPLEAEYHWVRYTAGEDCAVSGVAPEEPPPPDGLAPGAVYVGDVDLGLTARGTQGIARVTVLDGSGNALGGVTVTGEWSGAVSGGDTERESDGNGVATFYSSRSRSSGTVTFCVTTLSGPGLSYSPDANLETCASIVK